jgi:hypothetical protein
MEVRFQTTVHIHPKLRAMIETEVLDLLLSIQLFGAGQSEDAARDSGPTSSHQTPSLAWGTGASALLCETNPLPVASTGCLLEQRPVVSWNGVDL